MKVKVAQLCPTLCFPMVYTVHGILQARILEWVAFAFSRGSSQPWIEPRSPTLQVDSLPPEPQGKPRNTGMGSLSLLQQIFLTQESNRGLPRCRQILYQQLSGKKVSLLISIPTYLGIHGNNDIDSYIALLIFKVFSHTPSDLVFQYVHL